MGTVRLSSLSLEGFKSFATRAEFSFPGAITAVVGPNGAGKSNIADAIAWVLGEQSARLLRSQTMADVVFAGAPSRPPLGTAEVQLTLVGEDSRWSHAGGRLEISRRVFRDGTSEYRLWGKRARLKDVADQLFDAGLGTRAYAIIEQGRIGQVLSLRLNERRALFEEAAGITKFRVRRHEAELRLAETRANLVRVGDIAGEVRRALTAVRSQARQAERHRTLRVELAAVRGALLAARRATFRAALEQAELTLSTTGQHEAETAAALAAREVTLQQERGALDAARDRLAAARAAAAHADAQAQRREAEELGARREHEDSLARAAAAAEEAGRLEESRSALALKLVEARGVVSAAAEHTEGEERAAEAAAAAAAAAEEEARAATAVAEQARAALLAAVSAATEARNREHRLVIELEQSALQATRVKAEEGRLSAHLAEVARTEGEAAQRERTASERARQGEEERQRLRTGHQGLTAALSELNAARDGAAHAAWQARHEREGIERQLASATALPTALARVLPDDALLGTVADLLEPPAELAPVLDAAYGDLLTLPVVDGAAPAAALLAERQRLSGTVAFVIAERGLAPRPSPLLEQAGVPADRLGWLSRALPAAIAARDDLHARELAAADPAAVVVLPGGGRRIGQRVEFPAGQARVAGVLELRAREREVRAREKAALDEESALVVRIETSRAELAALQEHLAAQDEACREAAEALAAAASVHDTGRRERERLERELEALHAEILRGEEERVALAAQLEHAREESLRLGERSSAAESAIDERARTADRVRESAATRRSEAERVRGQAAVARERLLAARRDGARLEEELAALDGRIAAARAEALAQQERAAAAENAAEEARAALAALLAERSRASTEAEGLEREEAARRGAADTAESETAALRLAAAAARDAVHAAELAAQEARASLIQVDEAATLTLGAGATLPDRPPAEEELPALTLRDAELAAALDALGPVNELALTERDELEQRHAFITKQRRDLEQSIASLESTVVDLDRTCAERLAATIAEVNGAFGDVFRALFGGGDAHVELSEPEDPLESGIDIRVRPPGKHTQSVLLLSGGEKALAAVALLLSLFRVRPAPFCVLDEVDAPLDDANVERLCRLLREMSSGTQFLLITHNRRTMAHADVLYGVTMEEPGVSRVVSVRLEEA